MIVWWVWGKKVIHIKQTLYRPLCYPNFAPHKEHQRHRIETTPRPRLWMKHYVTSRTREKKKGTKCAKHKLRLFVLLNYIYEDHDVCDAIALDIQNLIPDAKVPLPHSWDVRASKRQAMYAQQQKVDGYISNDNKTEF